MPNFYQLQPMIDPPEDAVPYGDLLGYVNPPNDGQQFDHLHVGMVQIPEVTVDPVFSRSSNLLHSQSLHLRLLGYG
jgi:hypothetical protein